MPELPEVEVVKKSLVKRILRNSIKKIKISNSNLRYKVDPKKLKLLINKKIIKIKRKSKYLIIDFENEYSLLAHLGMTGYFYFKKNNFFQKTSFYISLKKNNNKHDHIIFVMQNDIQLVYNDIRRFGFLIVKKTTDLYKMDCLKNLGPEPLSKNFRTKLFEKNCKKEINIKNLLMNQTFVSGLGNIYANEILFRSKIYPEKKVNKLIFSEYTKIIKNTKYLLKRAIYLGGSSIKNFKNTKGDSGTFQENFKVYGREGMTCKNYNCKSKILRIITNNRSSFYCPSCQK